MIGPDSTTWKALEIYGTKIRHRGKWRVHRWLVEKLQASCDRDFEVERLGLRWLLNPSDFVQSSLYWTSEFETWDWFHLSRLIGPAAVICDIGANFGFYTLMSAQRIARGGMVYAFEPCEQNLSRLRANIHLNSLEHLITVVPIGLSNKQGYGYLGEANGNSGARALAADGERILLDTLDRVCEEKGIHRVDIIKVDVEGHELAVLEGAAKTIQSCMPVILIECNDAALHRSGASTQEMAARLRSWGYRLFVSRRKKLVPMTSFPAIHEIVNIFALGPHLSSPARGA